MQRSWPKSISQKLFDCMESLSIISDRGTQFTSTFWKTLHAELGTRLDLSNAFHPRTDGQSERTIQVLEDMLRACVIEWCPLG